MSTTLTTSQFEQVKRLLRVLFDGALEDGVYELTCHPTSRLESSGESLVEVRLKPLNHRAADHLNGAPARHQLVLFREPLSKMEHRVFIVSISQGLCHGGEKIAVLAYSGSGNLSEEDAFASTVEPDMAGFHLTTSYKQLSTHLRHASGK